MESRRLGRSGLQVSTLGLGTMTWGSGVDHDTAGDLLVAYTEAGGTLLDSAPTYGEGAAESWLGEFLTTTVPRDEVVLVSKAGLRWRGDERTVDTSRRGLLASLDASLRRLRTDHLDILLAHVWDPQVPLEETLGALEYAVTSGRARYAGVSNYRAWQATRAFSVLQTARIPLVANEIEYSLVNREHEDVLAAGEHLGFGVLAWAPLGRGVLTGKYRHGIPPDSRAGSQAFPGFVERFLTERAQAVVEATHTAARGLDVTTTEVALAWTIQRPGVGAVLTGPRTLAQLRTALAAQDLVLPDQLCQALDEVSERAALA